MKTNMGEMLSIYWGDFLSARATYSILHQVR